MEPTQFEILGKVALAMLLAGLIGYERELAERPAGLRTLMLVGGAATLLVALGDAVLEHYAERANGAAGVSPVARLIQSDPIRIIEAIVTGVSFLGAGTIFRRGSRDVVEGLTTAASILFVAAIGISVALEQFVLAAGAAVLGLVILRGVGILERRAIH